MKTFTTYKGLFQQMTQNYSADALNFGIFALNDSARTISNINKGTWKWLEDTGTVLTVQGQRSYQIPNRFRKVITTYVQIQGSPNTVIWRPEPVYDPGRYELLLQARLGDSDVARYAFIQNNKLTPIISFIPAPNTSNNIIHFRGRLRVNDITREDITNATIQSVTNGATLVTFNGTPLNDSMNGEWLKINQTATDVSGDGAWYQIDTVLSSSQLTLVNTYEGETQAAASMTCVIGQAYPIPEAYDTAVLYRALALYWTKQKDLAQAKIYWMLYDGGNEAGFNSEVTGIIGQMFFEEGETFEGPYISPDAGFRFDPNNPQPDAPGSSFI